MMVGPEGMLHPVEPAQRGQEQGPPLGVAGQVGTHRDVDLARRTIPAPPRCAGVVSRKAKKSSSA